MKILTINCHPDFSWLLQRGLLLSTEHIELVHVPFALKYLYKVKDADGTLKEMYTPDVAPYLSQTYPTKVYDVIIVGWSPSSYGPELSHTGGYSCPDPLPSGTRWITVRQDTTPNNLYPVHEMMHQLCNIINIDIGDHTPKDFMDLTPVNGQWLPYYENDYNIIDPLSNFNQTWKNIIPFLGKLNAMNTNTYKYFKASEIVGLKPELVALLDKARSIAGTPFKLTSGLRSASQNASVGGVPNSAHLTGEAADIACTDSQLRFYIVKALLEVGFNRVEICPSHIHCDISKTLPQNVVVLSQNG